MVNKKGKSNNSDEVVSKNLVGAVIDEEATTGEDSLLDPAIIEDTFTEEAEVYNDTDYI